MAHPSDRSYSKEHEWVVVDGDVATIGISHFAQDQLGEVVYVDLPSAGDTLSAGETFGEIESVKSVSELYAPVSGEVIEVNDGLGDTPETVNADPHGAGWMVKVKLDDAGELDALLSAEDYDAFITEG
ncbi:MAG: glycine cleavage system protein GcvH [Actinobacteria bacterium]|nr:MAG: glycine cleavage system protein GcvH [Actinomycetota bacterium]